MAFPNSLCAILNVEIIKSAAILYGSTLFRAVDILKSVETKDSSGICFHGAFLDIVTDSAYNARCSIRKGEKT